MFTSRWMLAIVWLAASLLPSACTRSLGAELTSEGCRLHHTQAVSPETATTVLDFLVSEGFCSGSGRHVQLDVTGEQEGAPGNLVLRIATRPEARADAAYLNVARAFAAQLSGKALDGRLVDVAICDEDLVVVTEAEGFRWGVHVALEACGVFVGEGVSVAQGERFLKIVAEDLGCDASKAFRLGREEGALHLSFVLEAEDLATVEAFQQARLTAGRTSTLLFEGEPIVVHAADVYYTSRRSAPSVVLGTALTLGSCTVLQSEGVAVARARRFLTFVEDAGYCRGAKKTYRLSREGEAWHVGTVVGAEVPEAYRAAFKTAMGLVAAMFRGAVFDGDPTHIDLCDALFEVCDSIVGPDFGRSFAHKNCSIFHDPTLDTAALSRLRAWMDKEGFCDGPEQLVRLRRDGEGWAFLLAVREAVVGTPEIATLGGRLVEQLTRDVLDGASVRFVAATAHLMPATAPTEPLPAAP